MFTNTEVINSTSVLPVTFQFLTSNLFVRFCSSEDHFAIFALGLWITWGGPVLSPVELPKNTTYNKHSPLWLFYPQRSTDIDYSTTFCSCLESRNWVVLFPSCFPAWIKKQGSKLVCLVLSQHFYSCSSPRQPWQDIDGPLLSGPLHSPFC